MRPQSLFLQLVSASLGALVAVGAAGAGEVERQTAPLTEPLIGIPVAPWLPPSWAEEELDAADRPRIAPRATPSFEDEVMELTNQERWNNGQLPPLKRHSQLDAAAEDHSTNMAVRNFFAHCDPDTLTLPWDRMTAQGYPWIYAAENIAAGYSTPQLVINGWMASSGHRANILSTAVHELGIGYYYQSGDLGNIRQDQNGDCTSDLFNTGPYYRYWTQNFGRRSSVYPVVIDREAFMTGTRNVSLYLYGDGWATEMRIRNENGTFTAWMPFASDVAWQLSSGGGTKTVTAEIRNGATVRSASDDIFLDIPADTIFTDGFESGNTSAWFEQVP